MCHRAVPKRIKVQCISAFSFWTVLTRRQNIYHSTAAENKPKHLPLLKKCLLKTTLVSCLTNNNYSYLL